MAFIKSLTAPNGAPTTYHKIVKIEGQAKEGTLLVNVASWPSEADHMSGKAPSWMHYETLPLSASLLDSITSSLVTAGNFETATVVADTTDFDAAKVRKWVDIKATRDFQEFGGFTWDGSVFDSNPISVARITGSVVMAMLAANVGQPFLQTWKLADNTTRNLDGAQMMSVGLTLGQHVSAVHGTAETLYQAIQAATTQEELDAVVWPDPA